MHIDKIMQFLSNSIYHIYNRSIDRETIFYNRENYLFFLKKVRKHIRPKYEILAYCLIPNHFHLLINTKIMEGSTRKTKTSDRISNDIPDKKEKSLNEEIGIVLRSYTRAINKQENPTGSLFQQKTKAKFPEGSNVNYPFYTFFYIHSNPVRANPVNNLEDWEYSSYLDYSGMRNGTLCNIDLTRNLLEIPSDPVEFVGMSMEFEGIGYDSGVFN